ncbi:hypothetical protein ES702_04129 [subsurface metagenome]
MVVLASAQTTLSLRLRHKITGSDAASYGVLVRQHDNRIQPKSCLIRLTRAPTITITPPPSPILFWASGPSTPMTGMRDRKSRHRTENRRLLLVPNPTTISTLLFLVFVTSSSYDVGTGVHLIILRCYLDVLTAP